MAKSGTHSIAGLLASKYRAAHEPKPIDLIKLILSREADSDKIRSYLRTRDLRLQLEMDSSQLNRFFITILADEFPDAKFILTIRDCYSWLDSFIDHQLTHPSTATWQAFRDFRFRPEFTHPPQESILVQHGLYTLRGYLSYWSAHNADILNAVPSDRLLVVRTKELSESAGQIASCLGVPLNTLDVTKLHSFQSTRHHHISRGLERAYLDEQVAQYCGPLMRTFFPDYGNSSGPH